MAAVKSLTKQTLNPNATNREVGFFTSESAKIPSTFTLGTLIHPFMWIEGYFSAADVPTPVVLVWDGVSVDGSGNKIVNPFYFAYSGQQKPCRGVSVVAAGVDYLGNALTATAITGDPTSGFAFLSVGGGAQP